MKKNGSVRPGTRLGGLALLCLLFAGLLAACGENPTATPTAIPPTPTPVKVLTPADIAKLSAEKLNTLNSLHFNVDIKSGQVELYQGITFKKAEGDFSKPDKFRAKLRVSVAIAQVDAETVGLEGQQYLLLTNLSKSWVTLPANVGFKPDVLFDPQKGVGAVVTKIQNMELAGTEQLDGVEVYHLKGVVKGADIAPLTASTLGKNDVNFDVWTSKSDFLVRRVTFKEISTEATASDWQLDFSKFNEPVTINRPAGVAAPASTVPATTTGPTTPTA
ncbi:MAG: hypothetical protein JWP00_1453 [Chloroflexi bacterium]|jgi:hypothetical protein|nr:hypothetical protein [Chloroflexota bacterium]